MAKTNNSKYDSGINIIGSVPDYNVMLDYISDTYGSTDGSTGAFEFRSEKSFKSAALFCASKVIIKYNNQEYHAYQQDGAKDVLRQYAGTVTAYNYFNTARTFNLMQTTFLNLTSKKYKKT